MLTNAGQYLGAQKAARRGRSPPLCGLKRSNSDSHVELASDAPLFRGGGGLRSYHLVPVNGPRSCFDHKAMADVCLVTNGVGVSPNKHRGNSKLCE